ncbi:ABC transporter permease [Spirochaetia bacterium]|nr:ABC transporter permease [Spirochaetia bacterium]
MRINRKTAWRIFYTVIMGVIALTMVLPFVWMISTSFKIEMEVFDFPIKWIPKPLHYENYATAWSSRFSFPMYYLNTIKVAVLTTLLQVTISAFAAYGFAKIKFAHNKKIFLFYLATLMIPAQVTLIPSFIIMKSLKLINTHMGIILISSFSVYGVFLLRQFISTVPNEMSEAAFIDGANHFQIFSRIIIPMVKPAISTLAMLKFIWTWNDYQNPLIFLSSEKLFTLQLGMRAFSSTEYGNQFALMMAAAVMAILPLMIVFFFFQRYVIEGIAIGAVKG